MLKDVKEILVSVDFSDNSQKVFGVAVNVALKIGLIVMGTHGFKGLDRVLFGSVAAQVVKVAPCPVLTVNPWR